MQQHLHYGDWTIYWIPAEPEGFYISIGCDIHYPANRKTEIFIKQVGCFRNPDAGVKTCMHLIDRCVQKRRQLIVELIENYVRTRQVDPDTAEIVRTTKENAE